MPQISLIYKKEITFQEYLKLRGYDQIGPVIHNGGYGIECYVSGIPNLKHFSQVYKSSPLGTKVRLSQRDLDNERIVGEGIKILPTPYPKEEGKGPSFHKEKEELMNTHKVKAQDLIDLNSMITNKHYSIEQLRSKEKRIMGNFYHIFRELIIEPNVPEEELVTAFGKNLLNLTKISVAIKNSNPNTDYSMLPVRQWLRLKKIPLEVTFEE